MAEPKLTLDQIGGDFKKIAEAVGIEAAEEISRLFGGLTISIPRLAALKREVRDEQIRAEYDRGEPVRRLAVKHELTTRSIYSILGHKGDNRRDL